MANNAAVNTGVKTGLRLSTYELPNRFTSAFNHQIVHEQSESFWRIIAGQPFTAPSSIPGKVNIHGRVSRLPDQSTKYDWLVFSAHLKNLVKGSNHAQVRVENQICIRNHHLDEFLTVNGAVGQL